MDPCENICELIDDCSKPIYVTPTSRSVAQERIDFQYEFYDILQEQLLKYADVIEKASPSEEETIIRNMISADKLLDQGLYLGRIKEEFLTQEIEKWVEMVLEKGAENVADTIEHNLSNYGSDTIEIRSSISDRTYYSGPDNQVLDNFQEILNDHTGKVLAEGLAWFREKASNRHQSNNYPIVVTEDSRSYQKRNELNRIIKQKPQRGSSAMNLRKPHEEV